MTCLFLVFLTSTFNVSNHFSNVSHFTNFLVVEKCVASQERIYAGSSLLGFSAPFRYIAAQCSVLYSSKRTRKGEINENIWATRQVEQSLLHRDQCQKGQGYGQVQATGGLYFPNASSCVRSNLPELCSSCRATASKIVQLRYYFWSYIHHRAWIWAGDSWFFERMRYGGGHGWSEAHI